MDAALLRRGCGRRPRRRRGRRGWSCRLGGARREGGAEQRAEHQATVRAAVDAAVDTVVKVAGERLGAQADAGWRELATRQHAFEQQVGELRGSMVDQLALRNAAVEQHMGDVPGRAVAGRRAGGQPAARAGRAAGPGRDAPQRDGGGQRPPGRHHPVAAPGPGQPAPGASGASAWPTTCCGPPAWSRASATASSRPPRRAPCPTSPSCCPATVLHMDVKFPVDNYLRYLEATSERERDQHAIAFVRDVQARARAVEPRLHRPRRHPRRGAAVHPQRGGLRSPTSTTRPARRGPAAEGGAVLAQHALLGARRHPAGGRADPPAAHFRRDPGLLGRVRAAVEQVLRCARQGGAQPRHRAPQLGRPVGHPAPPARAELDRVGEPAPGELGRDGGPGHEADVAIEASHTGVAGDAEARRQATGEILPLPWPPASAAG